MSASSPPPSTELAPPERYLERRAAGRGQELLTGVLLALSLLAAAALAGHRLWRVASGPTPPGAGAAAPAFDAARLDGGRLALEELSGEVVVLDFWATWCPPCVASLPSLERLHERYRDRGLRVVGVNQEPEAVARVRAFVASKGLDFTMIVDRGDISARYGVHSLPTTYVLDGEGTIRATFRGLVSERRLEQTVEALLPR